MPQPSPLGSIVLPSGAIFNFYNRTGAVPFDDWYDPNNNEWPKLTVFGSNKQQILYNEIIEGIGENWSPGGIAQRRVLETPWVTRDRFVRMMIGFAWIWPGRTSKSLRRLLPERHPKFSQLYATECRLIMGNGVPDGVSGIDGTIKYDLARYDVTYQPRTYKLQTDEFIDTGLTTLAHNYPYTELDRFVTKTQSKIIKSVVIPGNGFYYETDQSKKPIPEGVPRIEAGQEITYIWHEIPLVNGRIPDALDANIDACVGHVNQAGVGLNPVNFDNLFEPQTLFCLSPEFKPYYSAAMFPVCDIVYKFVYLKNVPVYVPTPPPSPVPVAGHNHLFRGKPLFRYERALNVTTGDTIYQQADFNTLFQF